MFRIISGNTAYDFGVITGVTDTFTKNLITTPIPSMPVDRTFAVETAASLKMNISFVRKNPIDFDDSNTTDSALWCNGTWLKRVSTLTDRWQARTNGYTMILTGSDAGELGVPNMNDQRIYITNITYDYKEGFSDAIFGSIEVTLTNQLGSEEPIPSMEIGMSGLATELIQGYVPENKIIFSDEDSFILISDSTLNNWYIIQSGKKIPNDQTDFDTDWGRQNDIVKSFTAHGGPSDPFEYLTLTISRKELATQYPALNGDILAGCNKLYISYLGEVTFTASGVRATDKEYTITAYCDFERIRGDVTTYQTIGTPIQIISSLIQNSLKISTTPGDGRFITNCDYTNDMQFLIKPNTNVWTAIQLCAMILNAKPFFANGKFYLIDYTKLAYNDSNGNCVPRYSGIFFSELNLRPENNTDKMYGRVTDEVDTGNEGIDTVINDVSIQWGTVDNTPKIEHVISSESKNIYLAKTYDSLDISRYIATEDLTTIMELAKIIAKNIINYRAEAQTSVIFEMKERVSTGAGAHGWRVAFPTIAATEKITVPTLDHISSAYSVYDKTQSGKPTIKPQKLYLSSYERSYPNFTSKYEFGVIENIDLSQSTSNIMQHVGMQ